MAPRVTVLTCTARPGGIDIAWAGLKNQSFTDFEWLVVDELNDVRRGKIEEFCNDSRVKVHRSPRRRAGVFWNLSRCLNYGVQKAEGELIVFLQDYIFIPTHGLERFVKQYDELKQQGDSIIAGVGHKYIVDSLTVKNINAPISIFNEPFDYYKHHLTIHSRDPRMKNRGLHLCNPLEWEANWAVFPRKAAFDVGGFDEDFDAGWGYDNVNFAERCFEAGYFSWLDENNESFSVSHEALFNDHDFKECAPNNEKLWSRKLKEINKGTWKLQYLSRPSGEQDVSKDL